MLDASGQRHVHVAEGSRSALMVVGEGDNGQIPPAWCAHRFEQSGDSPDYEMAIEPSALAGNVALASASDGSLWLWTGDARGAERWWEWRG